MKPLLFPLLFCSFLPCFCLAQSLENNQKALQLLDKAMAANPVAGSVSVNLKGTLFNRGHYNVPGKTRELPLEETYVFFNNEAVACVFGTVMNNGNLYTRKAVSKADSLVDFGYYEQAFQRKKSVETSEYRFQTAKAWPAQVLALAREHRKSLRWLERTPLHDVLLFSYKPNDAVTLFVNLKTQRLDKLEQLTYDDVYGNTVLTTEYRDYETRNGLPVPKQVVETEGGTVKRDLRYGDVKAAIPLDSTQVNLRWLPASFRKGLPEKVSRRETLAFERIAPAIDLIKIESQNNKMLVVDFGKYLALFETPAGLALNRQVLDEVQKRYPEKPLKYLFVTHHHPDHAGGIRAYAPLPLTLVTTPGNEAFFRKTLSANHSLGNQPETAPLRLTLDFVPLNGQKTYRDGGMEVVAYELGKENGHTDEHLVYYFPAEKILWTGDLLFFRTDGKIYPAGTRGKAVADLIEANKLDVERIFTAWPLYGQKLSGTVGELRKALEPKP